MDKLKNLLSEIPWNDMYTFFINDPLFMYIAIGIVVFFLFIFILVISKKKKKKKKKKKRKIKDKNSNKLKYDDRVSKLNSKNEFSDSKINDLLHERNLNIDSLIEEIEEELIQDKLIDDKINLIHTENNKVIDNEVLDNDYDIEKEFINQEIDKALDLDFNFEDKFSIEKEDSKKEEINDIISDTFDVIDKEIFDIINKDYPSDSNSHDYNDKKDYLHNNIDYSDNKLDSYNLDKEVEPSINLDLKDDYLYSNTDVESNINKETESSYYGLNRSTFNEELNINSHDQNDDNFDINDDDSLKNDYDFSYLNRIENKDDFQSSDYIKSLEEKQDHVNEYSSDETQFNNSTYDSKLEVDEKDVTKYRTDFERIQEENAVISYKELVERMESDMNNVDIDSNENINVSTVQLNDTLENNINYNEIKDSYQKVNKEKHKEYKFDNSRFEKNMVESKEFLSKLKNLRENLK